MKKIGILITTLSLVAVGAFGQGAVQFQNRITASGVFVPIYGVNPAAPGTRLSGNATTNGGAVNYAGVPLLTGTGFTASLWGAASATTDPDQFTQLSTAPFQTATTLPGIIRGPTTHPAVPWVAGPANGSGNFQVRVWDNMGGTVATWAAALARSDVAHGHSEVLLSVPVISAPNTPTGLVGLTSFNLTIVPEPSVIALGALGLGALLLRRRKQA